MELEDQPRPPPHGDIVLPATSLGVILGIRKFLALCLLLDTQLLAGIQRLQVLASAHAMGKKSRALLGKITQ